MAFKTALARGVYAALFEPERINAADQFLPGRTAFVYELEDGAAAADIPTTLRRSRADCPPVQAPVLLICRVSCSKIFNRKCSPKRSPNTCGVFVPALLEGTVTLTRVVYCEASKYAWWLGTEGCIDSH